MSTIFFCSCTENSPQNAGPERVAVPIPSSLQEADPLIQELIKNSVGSIVQNPHNADHWARHASALLANAYFEESVAASTFLLSKWKNYEYAPQIAYRQAIAKWRLNKPEEAIRELEGLLLSNFNFAYGWRRLAEWKLAKGEMQGSRLAIEQAKRANKTIDGLVAVEAQILLQEQNYEAVVELLNSELEQDTPPGYIYLLLSQAYRHLGQHEQLEMALEQSEPLPEQWADPWFDEIALLATGEKLIAEQALALLDGGDYKRAFQYLQKALEVDPSNSNVRSGLAHVYMTQNKLLEAENVLQEEPNPDSAVFSYWVVYGDLHTEFAQGKDQNILNKAVECYEKSISLSGGNPVLFQKLAKVLALQQNEHAQEYILQGANQLIDDGDISSAEAFLIQNIQLLPVNDMLIEKLNEVKRMQ